MDSFVIIGSGNANSANRNAVFREIVDGQIPDAHYLDIDALFRGGSMVYRVLTSRRLRAFMERHPLPGRLYGRLIAAVYGSAHSLRLRALLPLLSAEGENDLIFCTGTRIDRLGAPMLRALRERCPHCHLVYYLVDSVERTAYMNHCDAEAVLTFLRLFDAAFTYDRADAAQYGEALRFIEIPLWRSPAPLPDHPAYELYFCGHDKERRELLLAIRARLQQAGLRSRFRIVTSVKKNQKKLGAMYSEWTPYATTVAELGEANCVLEILVAQNSESSLRYKEAVLYNKKLLTTNVSIASLPYYDARWMRVFQTAEDIDLQWLQTVEKVDYGYRGDYSAAVFLRKVKEGLHE